MFADTIFIVPPLPFRTEVEMHRVQETNVRENQSHWVRVPVKSGLKRQLRALKNANKCHEKPRRLVVENLRCELDSSCRVDR